MAIFKSEAAYHAADNTAGRPARPWKTGFWKRLPSTGILALVSALLCGLATVVILVATNDLPINDWKVQAYDVQPTVVLSVLATLANALFRHAFEEGITISWWTEAQKGAKLDGLHRIWSYGESSAAILTSGRHFGSTAIASLFMLLLLADGPLLQRASRVMTVPKNDIRNLTVPISPSPLMAGATGIYADHDYSGAPTLYHPLFSSKVLQQYNNRAPITLPDFGCKGSCSFEVEAAGWDVQCRSWDSPFRLMSSREYVMAESLNTTNLTSTGIPPYVQTMFWTNVTYSTDAAFMWQKLEEYRTGAEQGYNKVPFPWNTILLSSMVKSTPAGNGTLSWRYCALSEAIQRYPVNVENGTATLQKVPAELNLTTQMVQRNEEMGGQGDWPSTLGGLWLSTNLAFAGKGQLQHVGGWSTVRSTHSSPLVYLSTPNATDLTTDYVTWTDPIDDMISTIRDLTFRTAIVTTYDVPGYPGLGAVTHPNLTDTQSYITYPNLTAVHRPLTQTVGAILSHEETVYKSHYGWLGGAMAIIGITFFAVLPIFGGWWHLGRKVSMSPIEIAKAFDAPLLQGTDDNGTVYELLTEIGGRQVRYGASFKGSSALGRSEEYLGAGMNVQDDDSIRTGSGITRRRLHIGAEGTLETPRQGETFGSNRQRDLYNVDTFETTTSGPIKYDS